MQILQDSLCPENNTSLQRGFSEHDISQGLRMILWFYEWRQNSEDSSHLSFHHLFSLRNFHHSNWDLEIVYMWIHWNNQETTITHTTLEGWWWSGQHGTGSGAVAASVVLCRGIKKNTKVSDRWCPRNSYNTQIQEGLNTQISDELESLTEETKWQTLLKNSKYKHKPRPIYFIRHQNSQSKPQKQDIAGWAQKRR